MKFIFALLTLLIPVISSASDEIKFHDAGENAYFVELTSAIDLGEKKGLAIIANAATQKCGDKPANLGKYRFQGQENLSGNAASGENSFRMMQQLYCGELPTITEEATRPLSDQEKSQLGNQAWESTGLYLDYLAKSDFKKAYALLSGTLKEGKTYTDWLESRKHSAGSPGDLMRSDMWKTTTYVDPPSSTRKGVYIAIDFDRAYARSPIYCGYLVWYLEDGKLKVIREDIGAINLDQFNKMKAEELAIIKSKFRCKP